MAKKSIDELSLEEVLEQLDLTSKQGRKYSLNMLIITLFELIEKLPNKNLDEPIISTLDKIISKRFRRIFKKDSQKAIKLFNTLSSKELQDKTILEKFKEISLINFKKAIELLNTVSSKELRDKIISDSSKMLQDKTVSETFGQIFESDSQKAIELLKSVSSRELQDKIISDFFERIFKRDYSKAIKLLNIISSKKLQDKIISEKFGQIFDIDSQKAIELLNSISSKELQGKIIFENFDKKISILTHGYIKIKTINQYMNFALKNTVVPNINLVEEIVNKDLKNRVIETFFNDFIQTNRVLSLGLLSKISDSRLREKIAINYLLNYSLMDMELLTFCSKNKIKEKLIPLKIDELNNIQKNINSQNRSNAIYKAHREVQKEDNSALELKKLTVSRLSFLIIHEEEESNFVRLLNEFSQRVQKEGENYSELIFKTIRDSKIQNDALFQLEAYIDKRAVINSLKNLKEDRSSQKSVNEILETVLKSTKKRDKDKEKYFLYLFRNEHNINTLHAVIPQIAIKDFGLAKRLLNRVQDRELKEKTQQEIFFNLRENLEQMMYAYRRVEDFHTKERLAKIALAHHLPTFSNSFFHKSLSALDSQNIINTLDELSGVAPHEVLKYYGEIEDDIEDRVDEVIEKIDELKIQRETAENLEDEELFDKVDIEAQKLKDEIQDDRELFEAFLKKLDITEFKFKIGSLWDLV